MILRARQTSNSHTTSYTYTIFTSTQQPTKRCLEQRQLNIGQMQLSYKQAPTSNIQHPYLKQVHTMLYAIGNQILNAPPPPPTHAMVSHGSQPSHYYTQTKSFQNTIYYSSHNTSIVVTLRNENPRISLITKNNNPLTIDRCNFPLAPPHLTLKTQQCNPSKYILHPLPLQRHMAPLPI